MDVYATDNRVFTFKNVGKFFIILAIICTAIWALSVAAINGNFFCAVSNMTDYTIDKCSDNSTIMIIGHVFEFLVSKVFPYVTPGFFILGFVCFVLSRLRR